MDDLKLKLIKEASKRCWQDTLDKPNNDSYVDNFAGGNIDDAYDGGFRSGETLFARALLAKFWPEEYAKLVIEED